jgi:hypothetical protein
MRGKNPGYIPKRTFLLKIGHLISYSLELFRWRKETPRRGVARNRDSLTQGSESEGEAGEEFPGLFGKVW